MKHSVLNRLLALGLALALCLSLAACSSSSDTEEEEVTNTVQAQAGGSVTLPEGFTVPEEAGRIATQASGDTLYGAFTLTNYNTTGYFTQNGSVTVTVQASLWTDAYFDLWKQGDGETQYVSTVHFVADDTAQSYTFSGLEAGASYRLSFGYSDVPRYKLSGKFSVTGITGEGTAEEPVANE